MFKLIRYSIFILFLSTNLYSQDETWFEDVTVQVGLSGIKSPYVQSADVNGDNFPDILVGTSGVIRGHSNTFTLYLNVEDDANPGDRKFVDYTEESGINVSRIPGKPMREYDMAILFDVDNDGDVDLVSSMYYHRLEYVTQPEVHDRSEVFLNDGTGHFKIKYDAGLFDHQFFPGLFKGFVDAVGLSAIDYDYDGDLDLYIATKFEDYRNNVYFPDILMKNNGHGIFSEVTDAGVKDIVEPLYGVNVTDYNNDGWQDVITSPYCRTGGRILQNMKTGYFTDVASTVQYSAQHNGGDWYYNQDYSRWLQQPLCQWEAPTADFDNDGDMDILQCLIHGGYESREGIREGHTHIAINQGPPDYKFIDDLDIIHRNANPASHLGDYGGLWVDFDNNGWLDVVICQGYYYPTTDRVYMCIQRGDNQFYDISSELGLMYLVNASDAQACDYDLDGDNDIFTFANGKLNLLRNDISNSSNWTSVKLIAPEDCNKDAIGARITLYTDSIQQIREIQTGLGHFGSQEPFIQNFGFGEINGIDSIIVRWPMQGIPITKIVNPPMNIPLVINYEGLIDNLLVHQNTAAIAKFENSRTDFGTVDVGETSIETITVLNDGDVDLNISSVELIEADLGNYSFVNTEDKGTHVIKPSETLSIDIEFHPQQRMVYRSVLKLNCDAGNGDVIKYDMFGYGYEDAPLIAVNDDMIFFDSTKTYQEKIVTISNIGEIDLIVDSLTFDDIFDVFSITEFEDQELQLPYTLKSSETLDFTLRFTPLRRNDYHGTLNVYSNSFFDAILPIEITGVGDAPTPLVKYDAVFINFSNVPLGNYKEKQINCENIGDGELTIYDITVEENDDNVYTFPGTELPLVIQPGADRDITLRFEPEEQITYNRKVIFYSDADNEPEKNFSARGKGAEPESVTQSYDDGNISISITPNPVNALMNISISNKRLISSITIQLYSLEGKYLSDIHNGSITTSSHFEFDMSSFASGTYLIVINYFEEKITIPVIKV